MKKLLLLLVAFWSILPNLRALSYTYTFESEPCVRSFEKDGTTYSVVVNDPNIPVDRVLSNKAYGTSLYFSVPADAINFNLTYQVGGKNNIPLVYPVYRDTIDEYTQEVYPVEIYTEFAQIGNVQFAYGCNKIVQVNVSPYIEVADGSHIETAASVNFSLTWATGEDETLQPIVSKYGTSPEEIKSLEQFVCNPSDVANNTLPAISTYTLDQEDYDYIIFTPARYAKQLERLAALRQNKGYGTKIVTYDEVYNSLWTANGDEISGINDNAGKLRAYITKAYQHYNTRNVLIVGRDPEAPIRYANYIQSDLYFSELNSSWHTISFYTENIDYDVEVNVGRLPIYNEEDLNNFLDKLVIYELQPQRSNLSYLADAFFIRQNNLSMIQNYKDEAIFEFFDCFPDAHLTKWIANESFPTGSQVISELNRKPYGVLNFIGHGNPGGVAVNDRGSEHSPYGVCALDDYEWYHKAESGNGLDCLTLEDYPSWSYSMSCSLIPFKPGTIESKDYSSIVKTYGESYLFNKAGGVAIFGNTHVSYSIASVPYMQYFFNYLNTHFRDIDSATQCILTGEMLRDTKFKSIVNSIHYRIIGRFLFNLLGDPLTTLWYFEPKRLGYHIRPNSINNNPVYWIEGNKDYVPLILSRNYVNDPTFAQHIVMDDMDWEQVEAFPNIITSIYSAQHLPYILPTQFYDIGFSQYTKQYFITGDLTCGKPDDDPYNGLCVFGSDCDVTIESYGNVVLQKGVIFQAGAKVTIKATGYVTLEDLEIPNNVTLHVTANTIDTIGDYVDIMPSADVTFIELNPRSNSRALIAENPHKPNVVVEGRTWTYISQRSWGPQPARTDKYDISIGAETEINGKLWHELLLSDILSYQCNEDEDLPGEWHSDPDPKVISYIREEGSSVYVLFDISALKVYDVIEALVLGYNGIICLNELCDAGEPHDGDLIEAEMIRLGSIGTQTPDNWLTKGFAPTIKKIDQLTYDDFSYSQYSISDNPLDFIRLSMVEKLGWMYDDEGCMIELFFAPSTDIPDCYGMWTSALLGEIKDADGTVLFRKNEDEYDRFEQLYNGVGDVTVDEGDARLRWFTPQGVEVTEPQTTGVYIRMTGNRAEKVYIP